MSFLQQIRRRNVFKVGVAYLAVAWLILQVASILVPAFAVAPIVMPALIVAFAIGFPVILVCAWIYELTPEGIRRTDDLAEGTPARMHKGRKLDFAIIAILALALIAVVIDQYIVDAKQAYDSIAVLPFQNLSGDPDEEYFADGMTEALIANLAKIKSLKVISRTSAMRFKHSELSLPQIAMQLGANVIVEASAQRLGERVRITAQLINATTDRHLWAQTFDEALSDVLTLQSTLAQAIAQEIEAVVTPEEQAWLAANEPVDPEAYDAYLRGLEHLYRLVPSELDIATEYFEQALTRDPDSALALSALGLVWAARAQTGIVPASVAAPLARGYAERAEQLDEALPNAQVVLGVASYLEWDLAESRLRMRRALALEPGHADARASLGNLHMIAGEYAQAAAELRGAIERDPLNPFYRSLLGVALLGARQYEESIAAFHTVLDIVPNFPTALLNLTSSLHFSGQLDEAVEAERAWLAATRNSEAAAAFETGLTEGGYSQAMQRVADVLAQRSLATGAGAVNAARHYDRAGDAEKVVESLERAYERHDPNVLMIRMPGFDAVRDDPRVQALIRRMGI